MPPAKKPNRPVKKSTLRNRADTLFSKLVRAPGVCARCGATSGLQCSHFISRRYLAVRYNPLNAEVLCRACHKGFTEHPLEAEAWATFRLGSLPFAELKRLAMAGGVPDYREVIAELSASLKALEAT